MLWVLPLYFHVKFVCTIHNSLFSFLNASHLNPEASKLPQTTTHPLCFQNFLFENSFEKLHLVPILELSLWQKCPCLFFCNAGISQRKRYLKILCHRDCMWPFVILAGQFTSFAHLVSHVGTWQTGFHEY